MMKSMAMVKVKDHHFIGRLFHLIAFIFFYSGCSPQLQMMYAGSMKSLVSEIGITKVVVTGFVVCGCGVRGMLTKIEEQCIDDDDDDDMVSNDNDDRSSSYDSFTIL